MTDMDGTTGFVTEDDYIVVGSEALKIIQQSKAENRNRAELAAREEISGYLRERYDVARILLQRISDGTCRSCFITAISPSITWYAGFRDVRDWKYGRNGISRRPNGWKKCNPEKRCLTCPH